jgi:2-polyprenyl-3-methyl-5-hydroxy-6-metoxy-1,4-benzoquinol methylase
MPPERMVHALETIHTLIKPGGVLLDIHPRQDKAWVEAQVNGKEYFLDVLEETDDYIEYKQANEALAQVVENGQFAMEETGKFIFIIHADSMEEMRSFLVENWKDAILNKSLDDKAREYFSKAADSFEILIREEILITRYKRT